MQYHAALDTSATTTAICVVKAKDGEIALETSVTTDPEAIWQALEPYANRLLLVGHEATSWSAWLHRELEKHGIPMVLLETHHAARMLDAQRNKTDKNDARGLAQLVRSGWFKQVHAKSERANRMKLLLAHRRTLKRKLLDIENEVRQSLKMFGLMVGPRVQRSTFCNRVRELVAGDPLLQVLSESMLTCWQVLWDQYRELHKMLVQLVGQEELCRRWCEIPGVGPVTAMTFMAAVDDPHRFAKSKTLGAHFGLTPKREQSGTSVDRDGHISRRGDGEVRTALYEAASGMLTRSKQHSTLKAWGMKIATKRGHKRAVVAVARKLAVIMHRMWIDGSRFRFSAANDQPESSGNAVAVQA
ncbi:IS110 family transposase [Qipengyuania citrea]|jgi:transposase|uniref:Transposase n=3 Tax=Erythrobacteraceae TaxID=335929 RepID=A0A0G3XKG4_9SPHN|nr:MULTISPECIES: IS110 family transposase [Erythrobacteraceae]MBL4791361.1 IS110 family transposase [Citromicrobium sp.]MBL4895902.1 IS110 family transposase [Erythrobacter sp.]MEC9065838.1 IS110 family transposase [Pseudomonadota bacterium]AKM11069.1 transposase [Croceicoccus naphthovorans]MBB3989493.1 transposase [Croceicoccus naphthovorans]|tara:strand:+ start:233 stop:1306 length:1074 start_codon:yes stop_codon:yes gene_type:complete